MNIVVVVVVTFLTFVGGNVLSETFVEALVKVGGLVIEFALVAGSELGFRLLLFFRCVFL